jgi:hypothetical protein
MTTLLLDRGPCYERRKSPCYQAAYLLPFNLLLFCFPNVDTPVICIIRAFYFHLPFLATRILIGCVLLMPFLSFVIYII